MKKSKKISAIIPAYNEEDIILTTLEQLDYNNWIDELIVVDDGSTDATPRLVKGRGVKLINLKRNLGKGAALNRGIEQSSGEIILFLDADLGKSAAEASKLIQPLLAGQAEAAVAVLPIKGGGLGIVRGAANFCLKLLSGKTMQAPLSGQRAFRREVLLKLLPLQSGYGVELGLDYKMLLWGINFVEVECAFSHRVTGQNLAGYWHRGLQLLDICKAFWQLRSLAK